MMKRCVPLLLLALLPCGTTVQAENWTPTRPLRLIVPFPPGGTSDLLARSVKELISQAKAKSHTITFGSAGIGLANHIAGELLKLQGTHAWNRTRAAGGQ